MNRPHTDGSADFDRSRHFDRSPAGVALRVRRFWLIAVLLGCGFIAEAPGQTTNKPPAAERTGTDAAAPRPIIDFPSMIVVDDPNRMGDLFKRLDTPDFQLIRPGTQPVEKESQSNRDAFVKSVMIRGSASGTIADLTIALEIQQTGTGMAWTEIGLDGLTLRSVRSGNAPLPARVARPGGPWQVRTDSVGTHRVEIELGTEIVSDRTSRRLSLSIPEAASTELALDVAEQVLFASTNARDSLRTRFDTVRNLYVITGLLTPRGKLELRWLGQSLIRNVESVRLECRGQVAIRMDFDAISTRQFWQIRPLAGSPAEFSFELPESETLLDIFVDGQATRPRIGKGPNGQVVVQVDQPPTTKRPSSEPLSIEFVTRMAYPPEPGEPQFSNREMTWQVPRWGFGEIVSGIVALEMPDRWVTAADPGSAFEPVDPRDLSDRLRKSANQAAYRFTGTGLSHTFRIRRRRPPLFTDARTIGIVRRSQVEYVSDIVIQGEIDPMRDYEIELDRSARPLFVGPRDVWERYEFVGESTSGERKNRRLRLTPNKALKAETPATLRIRYLRRSESPESFMVILPRFVESTGESFRTWLLPEPALEIEPLDTVLTTRRKLPAQDVPIFSTLLEQSVGDEDKWIKPRNAVDTVGVYFRFANPSEKELTFRTISRPPSLDYNQHLIVRPGADAIRIRHIFECIIDRGDFDRIVLVPSARNPIRNLRYALEHDESTQSGTLLIEDGHFEIPLPTDLVRRFRLTLEADRTIPERKPDAAGPGAASTEPLFHPAAFDFSIADGVVLQRDFTVEESAGTVARLADSGKRWFEIPPMELAESGKARSWAAAEPRTDWPEIRLMPLAAASNPETSSPIRTIDAILTPGPNASLFVVYRFVLPRGESLIRRVGGLSVDSAEIDGEPVDVAETGEFWSVVAPENRVTDASILKIRYRYRQPVSQVLLPLPVPMLSDSATPTRIAIARGEGQRILPPWNSGWRIAPAEDRRGLLQEIPPTNASNYVHYRSDDPRRPLPIRRASLPVLLPASFVVSALAVLLSTRTFGIGPFEAASILTLLVSAMVASGQTGFEWAAACVPGFFAAFSIDRFLHGRIGRPKAVATTPSVPSRSGVTKAASSLREVSAPAPVSAEPSTVLKMAVPQALTDSQELRSRESPAEEPGPGSDEPRWSLTLEGSTTSQSGSGLTHEDRVDKPR